LEPLATCVPLAEFLGRSWLLVLLLLVLLLLVLLLLVAAPSKE